ncbi:MAG: UrcA family protein [Sphingomonas sp.]
MLTLLSTLALAFVAAPNDAPGVRVSYADLDLSSPAGVATLDRRLARAVNSVCPDSLSKRLSEIHAVQACRTAALRQANALRLKATVQTADAAMPVRAR